MTAQRTPPDFSLLSRFVDGELSAEETRAVQDAVRQHPETQEQLARIQSATQALMAALAQTSFWDPVQPPKRAPACLSPEEVAAYVAHAVSGHDKARLDAHIRTCDVCVLEAVQARRIVATLDPQQLGPVPQQLTAQAEALWQPTLSRIMLDLTHRGLQHVAYALTAPFHYFELEPLGATLRSSPPDQEPLPLTFRLDAAQVSIRVTSVAARDGITLTLTVYGEHHNLLTGTRVQIRQEGLIVFSAKTDAHGQLHVPYLSPGLYEIGCPQLQVTFHLDLRAAQETA